MKKIILSLIVFMSLSINAFAWANKDCNKTEIQNGLNDLTDISINMRYADDLYDEDGNIIENYIYLSFSNLPYGYYALFELDEGVAALRDNFTELNFKGGVYNISFYSSSCDTPIKNMEFRIPHYNEYCSTYKICSTDPWFDGTFENKDNNTTTKNKVSLWLIITLIVLVIIIGVIVVFVLKRRKDNEKVL